MRLTKKNIRKKGILNNKQLKEYKLELKLKRTSIESLTNWMNKHHIVNITQRIYKMLNKEEGKVISEIRFSLNNDIKMLSYDYNNTLYIAGDYKKIQFDPDNDITIFIDKNNYVDIFITQMKNDNIEISYHFLVQM